MSRKYICYALDSATEEYVSRDMSTGDYALEILDFEQGTPENGFQMGVHLERVPARDMLGVYSDLVWTRKVPVEVKNRHRVFWGMKPLKVSPAE